MMSWDDGGKDVHEGFGDIIVALRKWLPEFADLARSQYDKNAEAELGLMQKYSPQMAQASYDLLSKYGPLFQEYSRQQGAADQMAGAKSDLSILQGAGGDAAREGLKLSKQFDPEFYDQRAKNAGNFDKWIGAMDPTKLTAGEQEEVSRGLGRMSYGVGSPTSTAFNAMQFGSALKDKRDEFGKATMAQNQGLNSMRSGMDPFQMATRRPGMPQQGMQHFGGLQTPGIAQNNSIFGSAMGPMQQAMGINMNKQISDFDRWDRAWKVSQDITDEIQDVVKSIYGGGMMGG